MIHPQKFTKCTIREFYEKDGTFSSPCNVDVPLTDEEYVLILAAFISDPKFTMNKLIYKLPEIGSKIMAHIVNVTYNDAFENPNPFIVIFNEMEDAARMIRKNNNDM